MLEEFTNWLINRAQLSPNTADQYSRRIRQALEVGFDPRKKDDKAVEKFILDSGGSPSNHDHWAGAFRRYQEYLNDNGGKFSFANRLQTRRRPVRLPKPVAFGDLYNMLDKIPLDTIKGKRDRAICEILYCGLRNGELVNTNIQDYDDKEVRVIGKGNKERLVPLNDVAWNFAIKYALEFHSEAVPQEKRELSKAFVQLRDSFEEPYPMFWTMGDHPVSTDTVRDIVREVGQAAGLPYSVNPHRLRHSFATHVLDFGASDPLALKDVMGHETMDMINYYVRTSKTRRFDRINAFHPRQMDIKPKEVD